MTEIRLVARGGERVLRVYVTASRASPAPSS
jgi:hypothetical protein